MASFFDTLFAPFNPAIGADAAAQAAQAQTAGITQGMGALTDTYGQGRGALQSNFMQGLQPFLQNVGTANRGMSAIADAMGLNGPKGTQNAYASFLGTVEPAPCCACAPASGTLALAAPIAPQPDARLLPNPM